VFRNCRYEVIVYTPNEGLWSRHSSLASARRSYREAVNNRRGNFSVGTLIELRDNLDTVLVLERGAARP
jgi:hypothetical protein